jgi:DNA-binding helix-turn-helix protein|nr:MAG TPA: regulatory protein [Caudoviricetes sp.]
MDNGSINRNDNMYFKARKEASLCNEKLFSREGASEMLGVSVSTLADYELGNTKVVPVDKVVLMADLYNAPELKRKYCKNECPIGKTMTIAVEVGGIEGIVLRIIRELAPERLKDVKNKLIDIASDGIVSESEKPELKDILSRLKDIQQVISEVVLLGEKILDM